MQYIYPPLGTVNLAMMGILHRGFTELTLSLFVKISIDGGVSRPFQCAILLNTLSASLIRPLDANQRADSSTMLQNEYISTLYQYEKQMNNKSTDMNIVNPFRGDKPERMKKVGNLFILCNLVMIM